MDAPEFDAAETDALFELLVIAAAADDEIGAEEKKALAEHLEALTVGKVSLGARGRSFEASFADALGRLALDGREARLRAIAEALRTAERREAALATAIRVFAADGVVRTAEREAILEIAEALGVPTDRAADLVRAIA